MADVLNEGANSEVDNSGIASAAADAWAPPSKGTEQIALAPPPPTPSTPTDTAPARPDGNSDKSRPPGTENSGARGADSNLDKPKTKEQWDKEFEKLAEKLAEDIKAGKFSPEGLKAWQKFFTERAAMPGADAESLRSDLVRLGTMINGIVEKDPNAKFRIGQAMTLDLKTGNANYFMNIRGPGIDPQGTVDSIVKGKDSPTVIRVGQFKVK